MALELVKASAGGTASEPSQPDLAAEANHRVANSLSVIAGLLRMQAASISSARRNLPSEEVRLLLEEFGARLDAVSRLHRLLASSDHREAIDLAGYLQSVAEAVVASLSFAGLADLRFEGQPGCAAAPKKALWLGLIVGELVTNTVKYAHPTRIGGEINVSCHKAPGELIIVRVSDDGVGLPDGLDPTADGHLGFRLVHMLARQLGAEITFEDDGLGLTVTVRIPERSLT